MKRLILVLWLCDTIHLLVLLHTDNLIKSNIPLPVKFTFELAIHVFILVTSYCHFW